MPQGQQQSPPLPCIHESFPCSPLIINDVFLLTGLFFNSLIYDRQINQKSIPIVQIRGKTLTFSVAIAAVMIILTAIRVSCPVNFPRYLYPVPYKVMLNSFFAKDTISWKRK